MPSLIPSRHYENTVNKLSLMDHQTDKGWHMRHDECEWIDDVVHNITNQNDNLKPSIAALRFDTKHELPSFPNSSDSNCFQYLDLHDNLLTS